MDEYRLVRGGGGGEEGGGTTFDWRAFALTPASLRFGDIRARHVERTALNKPTLNPFNIDMRSEKAHLHFDNPSGHAVEKYVEALKLNRQPKCISVNVGATEQNGITYDCSNPRHSPAEVLYTV